MAQEIWAQEIRRHRWASDYSSGTVWRCRTGRAAMQKKPRPLGSRGFAARAEGLHSGTARAADNSLALCCFAFVLGPDILPSASTKLEQAIGARHLFRWRWRA